MPKHVLATSLWIAQLSDIFICLCAIDCHWCFTFFPSLSDVSDLCNIKESAQLVGSLVGPGGLNLLINNAAILVKGTLCDTTPEDMQSTFNTNVMGPMNMVKVWAEDVSQNLQNCILEGNRVVSSHCTFKVYVFSCWQPLSSRLALFLLVAIIRSSCLTFVQQQRPAGCQGCPATKQLSSASPQFWGQWNLQNNYMLYSPLSPTVWAR